MLFNSVDFLVFVGLVAIVYPFLQRRVRARNAFLLFASYFFYGWWDARFLLLLLFSTVVDFCVAKQLRKVSHVHGRRLLLGVSIASNLGILAYFKYAGFFVDSAVRLFANLGMNLDWPTLHIILPVGISFYTFQTLSYTIDVYRGSIEPARRFLDFALYVAFFPQLVAGPIERAGALLPQLQRTVFFSKNDFVVGFWLILFGYFKKVYVADNIGSSIDPIFLSPGDFTSHDHALAVLGFSLQIYGDFSGYSDIARGVARCLGFQLMVNFRIPYFAVTPSEFWRRWHISLSTWLRDYLYISLGGNQRGQIRMYCNLMLTMVLGGLWHGASANFMVWGAFHGLLLIIHRVFQHHRTSNTRDSPYGYARLLLQWMVMMAATQIGWLIFRANSLTTAWEMLTANNWAWSTHTSRLALKIGVYGGPLVLFDI